MDPKGVSNMLTSELLVEVRWVKKKLRNGIDRIQVEGIHEGRWVREEKPPAPWKKVWEW
jgi:hypothetical protein